MRTILAIIVSCAIAIFGCKETKSTETLYLSYNQSLDSVLQSGFYNDSAGIAIKTVNICSLFNRTNWDSVAIILPYLPKKYLNDIDFGQNFQIRDTMEHVSEVEWLQGLIFFKDESVSGYSVVSGNPNFKDITDSIGAAIPVLKKSECIVILMKSLSANGDSSFFFVSNSKMKLASRLRPITSPKYPLDSIIP